MKKAITYLAAIALPLAFLSSSAMAQNSDKTSETTGPKRFWQSSLPGGDYVVALDRISSISKHSYIIDGNLRVTEVVIETNGNSLARFYYIIPVSEDSGSTAGAGLTTRGKELLDKVGERTGTNLNTAVMKQYPTTTHAKTVEFRISNEANLDKLFSSVRNAWFKGSGKRFSIKNE